MSRNQQSDTNKILAELENNPFLEVACKKSGVIRSTVYRWIKNDPKLDDAIKLAQELGRGKLIDFAESKLTENVKNGEQRAIEFFLRHNSKLYYSPSVKFYIQNNADSLEQRDIKIAELNNTIREIFDALSVSDLR